MGPGPVQLQQPARRRLVQQGRLLRLKDLYLAVLHCHHDGSPCRHCLPNGDVRQ